VFATVKVTDSAGQKFPKSKFKSPRNAKASALPGHNDGIHPRAQALEQHRSPLSLLP
jgi:hypothetical protein